MTFGLASTDPDPLDRTLKPSGYFYGEIARSHALIHARIEQSASWSQFCFMADTGGQSTVTNLKCRSADWPIQVG